MMSDDIKRPLNLRAMRSTRCRKHSSVIVVHIVILLEAAVKKSVHGHGQQLYSSRLWD